MTGVLNVQLVEGTAEPGSLRLCGITIYNNFLNS